MTSTLPNTPRTGFINQYKNSFSEIIWPNLPNTEKRFLNMPVKILTADGIHHYLKNTLDHNIENLSQLANTVLDREIGRDSWQISKMKKELAKNHIKYNFQSSEKKLNFLCDMFKTLKKTEVSINQKTYQLIIKSDNSVFKELNKFFVKKIHYRESDEQTYKLPNNKEPSGSIPFKITPLYRINTHQQPRLSESTDVDKTGSTLVLEADQTSVESTPEITADQTSVDSTQALTADQTSVDSTQALTADQTSVDSALAPTTDRTKVAGKADQTSGDSDLALNADQTSVASALSSKLDDVPSYGNQYLRQNSSWVIPSSSETSGSNTPTGPYTLLCENISLTKKEPPQPVEPHRFSGTSASSGDGNTLAVSATQVRSDTLIGETTIICKRNEDSWSDVDETESTDSDETESADYDGSMSGKYPLWFFNWDPPHILDRRMQVPL